MDKKSLVKMAIDFDTQLYEQAPRFEMYFCPKTLEFRVRYLAFQLYQEVKYKQVHLKKLKQRHEIFRKKVGEKLYKDINDEIMKTTRARKRAHTFMVKSTCCNHGVIDTTRELPKEARSILFHTRLIPAYMKIGSCTPYTLPDRGHWLELVIEARMNNDLFELWELKQPQRRWCSHSQCCNR